MTKTMIAQYILYKAKIAGHPQEPSQRTIDLDLICMGPLKVPFFESIKN